MPEYLVNLHRRLVHHGPENLFQSILLVFLIPLALLYGGVCWIRNRLFDLGLKKSYKASIPVVSVGNITAGGTGKTPAVDYLVKFLLAQGWRPAVVSRGYGGQFRGDVGTVSCDGKMMMNAAEAGDEPVLLARRNPGCQVYIARRRTNAVQQIEREQCADIVIMDDGFQHRSLCRDIDIVLLDAAAPLGNGWPLPAGNLREFKSGLKRADILLRTKCRGGENDDFDKRKIFNCSYQLGNALYSLDGSSNPLATLAGQKVLAFSGIADPSSFFGDLAEIGVTVYKTVAFPDHVDYRDLNVMKRLLASVREVDAIITTEKDAVKLVSDMFEVDCYYLSLDMMVNDSDDFHSALKAIIGS